MSRLARAAVIVLLAWPLALVWPAVPAHAHPFGDPQTVTVSGGDGTVRVVWRAGMVDDLTLLGIHLGVLPEDRVMLDGAITYEDGDPAAIAAADELHDYLLDRIGVSAGGADCSGEVVEVGDLLEDGATLDFACSAPLAPATVTVRTLTDLHPAYRTLATGPGGQRAAYAESSDAHEFTLTGEAPPVAGTDADGATPDGGSAPAAQSLGASAALQIGAVLGVLLTTVVGAALVRRRRGRTTTPTPTP
jgi:hypothetical protein